MIIYRHDQCWRNSLFPCVIPECLAQRMTADRSLQVQIKHRLFDDPKGIGPDDWLVDADQHKKEISYDEFVGLLTISNPADTRILKITATYPDPETAQQIANAKRCIQRYRNHGVIPVLVSEQKIVFQPLDVFRVFNWICLAHWLTLPFFPEYSTAEGILTTSWLLNDCWERDEDNILSQTVSLRPNAAKAVKEPITDEIEYIISI